MGTLAIKSFDLVYKRLGPTGSSGTPSIWSGYLPQFWWTASLNFPATTLTPSVSGGWLNFPPTTVTTTVSTRQSSSNATYKGLVGILCNRFFMECVNTIMVIYRQYCVLFGSFLRNETMVTFYGLYWKLS